MVLVGLGRDSLLLLDVQVICLDLSVNATLGLGTAVLVHEVLEAARPLSAVGEPDLRVHLLRGVHIAWKGREKDVWLLIRFDSQVKW